MWRAAVEGSYVLRNYFEPNFLAYGIHSSDGYVGTRAEPKTAPRVEPKTAPWMEPKTAPWVEPKTAPWDMGVSVLWLEGDGRIWSLVYIPGVDVSCVSMPGVDVTRKRCRRRAAGWLVRAAARHQTAADTAHRGVMQCVVSRRSLSSSE